MPLQPSRKVLEKVVENEVEVINELCGLVSRISLNSIEQRGRFTMGLSGGSMANFVCKSIPTIKTDWSKWKLFFCDERLVPEDHSESILRLYIEGLIGNTPLTRENFVSVDTSLDVAAAASDYEQKLKNIFPNCDWPTFDLLLLGVGPDGHTASLFPGHPLLNECNAWIAPISDSPKPPPSRVTMTFPVINHAKTCVFAVSGEGKASILKKILLDKDDLPASRVNPQNGELYWIMDKPAAVLLKE